MTISNLDNLAASRRGDFNDLVPLHHYLRPGHEYGEVQRSGHSGGHLHLIRRHGVDEARNDVISDDVPAVLAHHQAALSPAVERESESQQRRGQDLTLNAYKENLLDISLQN